MTSPVLSLLRRALVWLRRHPGARADALELAAEVAQDRARQLDAEGRTKAAVRARRRATALVMRAAQLRSRG